MTGTEGFILSRQWQEKDGGQDLIFWLVTHAGPLQVTVENQPSVFFIAESDLDQVSRLLTDIVGWRAGETELRTFAEKQRVRACYFRQQRDLNFARARLERAAVAFFEADIRPTDRYLMERFIRGAASIDGDIRREDRVLRCVNPRMSTCEFTPELHVVSLDIETSVTDKVTYSIAVYGDDEKQVFMVSGFEVTSEHCIIECLADERSMLIRFMEWFSNIDPDVVIGWNIVGFDLHFLQERCDAMALELSLGRASKSVIWRRATRGMQRNYALVPGRVILDGIELLRTATYSFESFSLEYVSRALLGEGKLVNDVDARAREIEEMYANDRTKLAEYNLKDCELVWEVFRTTDLMNFALERSRLTGLDLDRPGGSVAAFDFLYLPRLHREGLVAPTAMDGDSASSPGGFVFESRAGLYDHVVVLDFKSLYPSIIRTFHVDPLAMTMADEDAIPGFKGGSFSRKRTVLPEIIAGLWRARDTAKRDGRSAMSQAIKIIMNSFYGVLGTSACRFFDARLASSITMRGHEILRQTRDLIEAKGLPVIYGDTDSVFVHFGDAVTDVQGEAEALVEYLNAWWQSELTREYQLPCFLEAEYETHFERFLMPTMRRSEKGSKKRYAGLVAEGGSTRLVFKGLETVRSDWSPLAREFQQELYRRIFLDLPYIDFVKSVVVAVSNGESDDKLVLRRRVRRKLTDYVKNVPPHVRAARMAVESRAALGLPPSQDGGWIEYVMTVNGPEPVRYSESPLDYTFYIDRQLAPIADSILAFKSTSLGAITDRQLALF